MFAMFGNEVELSCVEVVLKARRGVSEEGI